MLPDRASSLLSWSSSLEHGCWRFPASMMLGFSLHGRGHQKTWYRRHFWAPSVHPDSTIQSEIGWNPHFIPLANPAASPSNLVRPIPALSRDVQTPGLDNQGCMRNLRICGLLESVEMHLLQREVTAIFYELLQKPLKSPIDRERIHRALRHMAEKLTLTSFTLKKPC